MENADSYPCGKRELPTSPLVGENGETINQATTLHSESFNPPKKEHVQATNQQEFANHAESGFAPVEKLP